MIEIIKDLFKLSTDFIQTIYNIEIDFLPDTKVKLGSLALAFIFFVLVIYFIFKIIGIGGDKE